MYRLKCMYAHSREFFSQRLMAILLRLISERVCIYITRKNIFVLSKSYKKRRRLLMVLLSLHPVPLDLLCPSLLSKPLPVLLVFQQCHLVVLSLSQPFDYLATISTLVSGMLVVLPTNFHIFTPSSLAKASTSSLSQNPGSLLISSMAKSYLLAILCTGVTNLVEVEVS